MNSHLAQELLNELGSSLESLEARNTALLQFLKDRGIVTDEQLAPCIDQAGNASSVRWRATRVRLERIFASATEAEEKAFEKLHEQAPKTQTPQVPAEQQTSTNLQPENAAKKTEAKEHSTNDAKKAGEVKTGGDETKPEGTQEKPQETQKPPAKAQDDAA